MPQHRLEVSVSVETNTMTDMVLTSKAATVLALVTKEKFVEVEASTRSIKSVSQLNCIFVLVIDTIRYEIQVEELKKNPVLI